MTWIPELADINTSEFRREAICFNKNGYYINAPKGTRDYIEYWDEQKRRRKEGYSVGGVHITGLHYGYLNFARIEKEYEDELGIKRKKLDFPDFWDGDYYYFHKLEEARKKGKGMIVAKSRRKGFSYKNSWIIANEFNLIKDSRCIVGAYLDAYANNTVGMAVEMLDFMNEYTGWKRPRTPDRRDFMRQQHIQYIDGNPIFKGLKSEIHKISFKDDPFKAIGKSCSIFLFEEAGKWPGLIESYRVSEPTWKNGDNMIGMPIIFGTGGDMEKGTAEFHSMFYHPDAYNLLSFDNIWDDGKSGTKCGFFFPDYINRNPHMDANGNSLIDQAKESQLKERQNILQNSKKRNDIDSYISQYPFSPQEAFLVRKGSIFPAALIARQLSKIESTKELKYLGDRGTFEYDNNGELKFKIDQSLIPVDWPIEETNREGCIQIWEHPDEPCNSPFGLYFATLDPYDQDDSESGSIGSMIIWKTLRGVDKVYDLPVAAYHGRPEKAKEFYENCRLLQKYFSAICLYENEKRGYEFYLEHKGESYLLKDQPGILDKIIKNSHVKRPKGTHMTTQIKGQCEIWAKDWLLEETSEGVYNLNKIYDTFLLKQLISYDPDGNFDSVISFLLAILNKQDMHNLVVKEKEESHIDPFFTLNKIFR